MRKKLSQYIKNPYRAFSYLGERHFLKWMPDRLYLRLLFRARLGVWPNFQEPQTFSEKLQWLKLHDRQPEYVALVDKIEAKRKVALIIGKDKIVPTLQVWQNADSINLEGLPDSFVLKANHDSSGPIICRDKTTFDLPQAIRKLKTRTDRSYYWATREWPYKAVQPRVFAEEYLATAEPATDSSSAQCGIIDYKFFCFHGEPRFIYLSQGKEQEHLARHNFLSLNWELLEMGRERRSDFDPLPPAPSQLHEMIEISRQLSSGIPFVRVDLFEHHGRILFSEMTFFPAAGLTPFLPEGTDRKLGEHLDLRIVNTSSNE